MLLLYVCVHRCAVSSSDDAIDRGIPDFKQPRSMLPGADVLLQDDECQNGQENCALQLGLG